jgi:hypothetical protein
MVTSLEKQLSEWLKLELRDLTINSQNMFSIASDNGYEIVGNGSGTYELFLRGELVSSFKPQINFIVYPEEKEKGEG